MERSEIDHLLDRPGRQEAEQVAQVTERLEPVHFAAGEQGDERGIDFAALVSCHEVYLTVSFTKGKGVAPRDLLALPRY